MPFAYNAQRRVVRASDPDVVRGRKCKCTCPACAGELEARKGQKRKHYFAHISRKACTTARETALHVAAKQILEQAYTIELPDLQVQIVAGQFWTVWRGGPFRMHTVRIEQFVDNFKPDIVATGTASEVLIEVYVTHRCSEEKVTWARKTARNLLEIDLSKLPWLPTWDELGAMVLRSIDSKKWLSVNGVSEILGNLDTSLCTPAHEDPNLVDCPLGDLSKHPQVSIGRDCSRCSFQASDWLVAKIDGGRKVGGVRCLANTGVSSYSDWLSARATGYKLPRNLRGLPELTSYAATPPIHVLAVTATESSTHHAHGNIGYLNVPPVPDSADPIAWAKRYRSLRKEGKSLVAALEFLLDLKDFAPRSLAEQAVWTRRLRYYRKYRQPEYEERGSVPFAPPLDQGTPAVLKQPLFAQDHTCGSCGSPMVSTATRALNGDVLWVCSHDKQHPRRWAPPTT